MLDAGDRLNSQEEVLNTVVRRDGDGNLVRIRNLVTSERLSHRDPSVIPSVDGQSTVRLLVTKEEKGNAIEISQAVKKVAREFETLPEDAFSHLESGLFAPFWKACRWSVEKILNHKIITFSVMTFILIASVGILVLSASGGLPLIKVEFFPGNYFRYHVTITTPVGTAIEQTDAIVRNLSRFIMSLGTAQAHSTSGSAGYYEDEDYSRHDGSHFGQIVVTLPEEKYRDFPENPSNDPQLHLNYIRRKLADFVQERYPAEGLVPVVRVFKESDGPPTGKAVNIRVTGTTLDDAAGAGDRLKTFLQQKPELADLVDLADNRPNFHKTFKFIPKQEAVFEYGLQASTVTQMVAGALNGQYVDKFRTIDEEVDLMVRIARTADTDNIIGAGLAEPMDILGIPVVEDSSSPILLQDLIEVKPVYEPDVKSPYKGKPTITLTADIKPGSRLSPARVRLLVNNYVKSNADEFVGIALSYGGEFESTSKSYASLTMAFFIALLAIYMVLASQFKDYVQPLIIISSVPMALIGVVFGLLITRTTFTIGSFLAIIGLAGLAVNDSLLLIDFMNVRLRRGKQLRQAIIESCAARMRPVLITTVTTTLGLLPMAIGIPNKSISWSPMATAFVSGLISTTILTLLITPANYEAFEQIKAFFKRIFRRRTQHAGLTQNSV